MKKHILNSVFAAVLASSLSADHFFVHRIGNADTGELSENSEVIKKLSDAVGEDPRRTITPEGSQEPFDVIYGRLLGVIRGETVEGSSVTFTDDIQRVQILDQDGREMGEPVMMSIRELSLNFTNIEMDTVWDFERFYGDIEKTFETKPGTETFKMALYGILDPTGEMGLNTLGATVDLPDEFTHGWLTNFVLQGKPELEGILVGHGLDNATAFDSIFFGPNGIANNAITYYNQGSNVLVEQLARDTNYQIYESGVRPLVLDLFGVLLDFSQIDPGLVQDPVLVERAKRLRYLGSQMEVFAGQSFLWQDRYGSHQWGRPLSRVDRAEAALDVIAANLKGFRMHKASLMEGLLNTGNPYTNGEATNMPHPDCAALALSLYFELLQTGALSGDEARDERQRVAATSRRLFAARGLMPEQLNEDTEFTGQTRAAFLNIGYGTTDEVVKIIDALDSVIPAEYMGEEAAFKSFEINMDFSFNEAVSPFGPAGLNPANRPALVDVIEGLYYDRGERQNEAIVVDALAVLKDIAFNLPPDALGRASKVAQVETWRQTQLEELEKSLERQIRMPDDSPPELTPEQKFFKEQLTSGWEGPSGVEG